VLDHPRGNLSTGVETELVEETTSCSRCVRRVGVLIASALRRLNWEATCHARGNWKPLATRYCKLIGVEKDPLLALGLPVRFATHCNVLVRTDDALAVRLPLRMG